MIASQFCSICACDFTPQATLSGDLVRQWGLSFAEQAAIQWRECAMCACGLNRRAAGLARAVRGITLPKAGLRVCVNRVLHLSGCEVFKDSAVVTHQFPETDLQALPFADRSVALLAHSDTLEHVPKFSMTLREARRVLLPHGVLAFTVPILWGRDTLNRSGLEGSYHGRDLVRWEFGADLVGHILGAGFLITVDAALGLFVCQPR